jgi:hypothetical protein
VNANKHFHPLRWHILLLGLVSLTTSCINQTMNIEPSYFKTVSRISRYAQNIPDNFSIIDFKTKALDFDQLLFNENASGDYLPLIWQDDVFDSFGIPAYVGDFRKGFDGTQEAVAMISALISATLLGKNKANENNKNYIKAIEPFFQESEKVVLNNFSNVSKNTSMWYKLYPGILFTELSILYPNESTLRVKALSNIDSWYQAANIMLLDVNGFDQTGFDFYQMVPYRNGIWKEPDSAVGVAMLMYYGYQWTQESKYLETLISVMDNHESFFGSSMYELLLFYAPFLASYLNTHHGKNYHIETILNNIFNGRSIPRGGWGQIVGKWGNYNVNGLMGSITDRNGYAFMMNSFLAGFTIPTFISNDTRYASDMGKYLLNLASNGRHYFPDHSPIAQQSCSLVPQCNTFNETAKNSVPYEGIISSYNNKSPWIAGDPIINDWGRTDLSLYSGAHTGLLASMIHSTSVATIPLWHINQSDYLRSFDHFLAYNPHLEKKEMMITFPKGNVDAYDLVSHQRVSVDSSGKLEWSLDENESAVFVLLPKSINVVKNGIRYQTDTGIVLTQDQATLTIVSPLAKSTVSAAFTLSLHLLSTYPSDAIKTTTIKIKNQVFVFEAGDDISLNTSQINSKGLQDVVVDITSTAGLVDQTIIILDIK